VERWRPQSMLWMWERYRRPRPVRPDHVHWKPGALPVFGRLRCVLSVRPRRRGYYPRQTHVHYHRQRPGWDSSLWGPHASRV
jgi:hypothetical protein